MSTERSFLSIGHRGARGHAPENTLQAVETGIRLGADWIEIDVQQHGEELLVFHDLRLERCTNGQGRLTDVPLDKLRRLDAGQGQSIPFLWEVLDLIEARVPVNIEIKSGRGTAALLVETIRNYLSEQWTAEQFLVSSFHHPELYELKQMAPEIPVGALICGVPLDWAACATELGAESLNISAEFVDERLIDDAHQRGLKVFAYTVNETEDMQGLCAMGLDGVFSDYPDRVLALRSLKVGNKARV